MLNNSYSGPGHKTLDPFIIARWRKFTVAINPQPRCGLCLLYLPQMKLATGSGCIIPEAEGFSGVNTLGDLSYLHRLDWYGYIHLWLTLQGRSRFWSL